ncbi:serine/threonine-protein kinase [Streptomyces sp. 6N223]|uniref:serine/threonine-protein kinase n=1 Tax=Streptomyces sp. 6N223 TaxID=3457412 RepID=UPI003FD24AA4
MKPLGPQDPQSIGEYRLVGRLGEGGMGQVYVARSARGRTVALKLVLPELARQPEFRQRFRNEVEAARRIGGAWTAPVLDANLDADTPWVATGYVAGPSLHEVVAGSHGPLPEHSGLALANGLVRALRDIHGAGLIHRDLKPSNVLVTIDGPRVIDFGIARAAGAAEAGSNALTRTGAVVGSPGFMSPEQCRGEQLTAASDVFCLGSVLAFAATGRTPFGNPDSAMHVLMLHIIQNEKDLSGIPDRLRGLIEACLAPDPAARPGLDRLLTLTSDVDLWHLQEAEPWLPAALIARLGRQAVGLLDSEEPVATPQPNAAHPPNAPTMPPSPPPPTMTAPPPAYGTPQPGATPSPYAPAPAPAGGFGAPTPHPVGTPLPPVGYGPGPGPGQPGGGRRNAMPLIIAACVAVVAVIVAVAVISSSGGSDDDKSDEADSRTTAQTQDQDQNDDAADDSQPSADDVTADPTDTGEETTDDGLLRDEGEYGDGEGTTYNFGPGETAQYESGLTITISGLTEFTPGEYAIGMQPGDGAYMTTVTVENNGEESIDVFLSLTARAGESGTTVEQIYDDGLEYSLSGTLLPGRQMTGDLGYAVPADAGFVDLEYTNYSLYGDSAIWTLELP